MKNLVVVAANKIGFCGVGNYTNKLVNNLKIVANQETEIIYIENWARTSLKKITELYKANNFNNIHIQYPSENMGQSPMFSIMPILFFNKTVITLHEFSVFNRIRKLYCLSYALFAKGIIFSNEYEAVEFKRFFPFVCAKIHIIPIGSNIRNISKKFDKEIGLIYFGQISKNKGLEEYIETVKKLRSDGYVKPVYICGALVAGGEIYLQELKDMSEGSDVQFALNLPESKVSEMLLKSNFALLPFADGLSEKRGSAIAAMLHGVPVITTYSKKTPDWMKEITLEHKNPSTTTDLIKNNTVGIPPHEILSRVEKKCSWTAVVERHNEIYG